MKDGTFEEGITVTLLVPEIQQDDPLTEAQKRELALALAEADRGECIDGWRFLSELRRS